MKDIENREDIELLIDTFYSKVKEDDLIGVFFTEVIKLDWDEHIPTICDFWESTLFGTAEYNRNPMIKHIELNDKKELTEAHFNRWLSIWEDTIRNNFEGKKADETIKRASQIAKVMQFKIRRYSEWGS